MNARFVVFFWLLIVCCFSNSLLAEAIVGVKFKGTDLAAESAMGSGRVPPDTMGSVGPLHVAEIINGAFAVYTKTGSLLNRTTLDNFWNTAFSNAGTGTTANFSFDPRILYDKHSGRWYAVAVDSPRSASSRVLVAVTNGNDPSLGNWHGFTIDADSAGTRWADFPTIGLDADGLYISNNMFAVSGGLTTTVTFIGVPKSSLTSATPDITGFQKVENINPNNTGFTVQPAVDLDNSGLPNPLLSSFSKPAGFIKTSSVPADFFSTGTLDTSNGFISVTARSAPPDAQAFGSPPNTLIDTGDNRFSGNVVLQDDSLWAAHSVDFGGRSAIEWYEISAVTNAILQSGVISHGSLALYYPSIAVNNLGDVVIGFSGSDASTAISTYFVHGTTTGGATNFGNITLLQSGNGTYEIVDGMGRNRWGDYSATVIDPLDERIFWTFQEYVDGNDNWSVGVSQIITTSTSIPEPASVTLGSLAIAMGGFLTWRRSSRSR